MPFFGNKRRDFSIQPPRQQVDGTPFYVTDSANIDFTLDNLNLTADLTFTGVTAGTYGDATNIPVLQIDQWGRITGVTLQPISPSGLALEVNGTPNGDQTLLNLVAGTNMTITDDGLGNITFDATGGGGTYTVNNGLTENPVGNFQLGSTISGGAPLLHDTYIDTLVNHTLYLEGSKTNSNDFILDVTNSTSDGSAIKAVAVGSGNAIRTTSVNASAISAVSTTAPGITVTGTSADGAGYFRYNSTANTVEPGIKLWHSTSATPAAGLGISLLFSAETTLNSGLNLGKIYYEWLNAVTSTRASKFSITTVGGSPIVESVKLSIDDLGQLSLPEYDTSTAFQSVSGASIGVLNVDNTGKVFVAPGGTSGGGITHATASGTDTYTATIAGVTSYADGDAYLIRFPNGNTTGATININGLGAISLYRNNDGPVIGGDIQANSEMLLVYNSTTNIFQCIGTSPNTIIAYVTNAESITITKGQAVYAFGGTGDRMTVKLANNSSDATSAQTVGLVFSASIAANQKGFIMLQGLLDGLNTLPTSTWNDGDPVYLGATAGSITPTKPYAPNHLVYLGVVTTASPGSAGRMYVKVQNGYELDELHNVQAQTPTVNDVLYYFGGTPGQWKTAQASTLLPTSIKTGSCGVTFDGQGGTISNGKTAYVQIPYNGTLTGWTLVSNASGSCTVTVFKDTYANFPPTTPTDNIYSVQPALSSQQRNQNLTPTYVGSQATVTAGDWIGFTISGVTTVSWVNLTISITKT